MKKSPEEKSKELSSKLDPLRSFVERTAVVQFPMEELFSTCLKASFVSTFKLVDFVSKQNSDIAFFLPPALRRPIEDIIYFRFISKLDCEEEEREKIMGDMMALETAKNLGTQERFFGKFRPFQPILSKADINIKKAQVKDSVRSFWKRNGWPNLPKKRVSPEIIEIAKKSDPGLLDVIYGYIYRLMSSTVHFNPQILLRSGWGSSVLEETVVSPANMGPYYLAVSQIYGSYILCLYFEFFDQFLQPNQEEKEAIKELRKHLLSIFRWPEIVTYEEMNKPIPNPELLSTAVIYRRYSTIEEKDFIIEKGFMLKKDS